MLVMPHVCSQSFAVFRFMFLLATDCDEKNVKYQTHAREIKLIGGDLGLKHVGDPFEGRKAKAKRRHHTFKSK